MLSLLLVLPCLQAPVSPSSEVIERWVQHYDQAAAEIAARGVEHLTPEQRANRARALVLLGQFRDQHRFLVATSFPGERRPHFRYPNGEHCAVGHLMHELGGADLVDRLAETSNHKFTVELAQDSELQAWMQHVGLNLDEVARIQCPAPPPWEPEPVRDPLPVSGSTPNFGSPSSPSPSSPGSAGPGRSQPGSCPTSPSGSAGAIGQAGPISPIGPQPAVAPDWWTWWQYNNSTWLKPQHLQGSIPDDGRTYTASLLELLRAPAKSALREALAHADARVRAAAAVSLARIEGPPAVPALMPLLEDGSIEVRRSALLALGATGSERAVHELLSIARSGRRGDGASTFPHARSLAVLSLGLARSQGAAAGIEHWLAGPGCAEGTVTADHFTFARLLFQGLAPSESMSKTTRDLSGLIVGRRSGFDDGLASQARARVIESLRYDATGNNVLGQVLGALGHKDIQVRRSAAITLGELGDPGALPPLKSAFELEREQLTRGFLLLSIGRLGGESARDFLVRALKSGPRNARPWAALALGQLARRSHDDVARKALSRQHAKEKNTDTRAALLLALGLARGEGAEGVARHELRFAKNSRTRIAAAYALSLLEPDDSRVVLLDALESEKHPEVRTVIAQSLSYVGDNRDVPFLLERLANAANDAEQMGLAVSLGLHGSEAAVRGLLTTLKRRNLSGSARAAAVQGLGMLLTRDEPYVLSKLCQGTNFTVLPEWFVSPVRTTL